MKNFIALVLDNWEARARKLCKEWILLSEDKISLGKRATVTLMRMNPSIF